MKRKRFGTTLTMESRKNLSNHAKLIGYGQLAYFGYTGIQDSVWIQVICSVAVAFGMILVSFTATQAVRSPAEEE